MYSIIYYQLYFLRNNSLLNAYGVRLVTNKTYNFWTGVKMGIKKLTHAPEEMADLKRLY